MSCPATFSACVLLLPCSCQGTTYNSYLIFGADKTALVDASHEKFRGLYMRTLNEELAKRGRKIDYVLVSHTEPDHSGAAGRAGCCLPAECGRVQGWLACMHVLVCSPPRCPPPPAPAAPTGLVKDVVEQFPEAVVVGSKVCLAVSGAMPRRVGEACRSDCSSVIDLKDVIVSFEHLTYLLPLAPCAVLVQPDAPAVQAAGRQGWRQGEDEQPQAAGK